MQETLNTPLKYVDFDSVDLAAEEESAEAMVSINHVSMVFNMASQKLNSLKEYFLALAHRELMFKEFYALDDVSFQVNRGDVFGILGTNGSGKSTMLKIIAGVLEPSKGSVSINGNIAPLIELGAGFDHELTARENIYLNGALLGYSKSFIETHFDDIVDFAEIRDFLDMPLKNYSSGMVARIAFAIATVIVPDILIVDEVLSVGDFMFQQKCEQRIQSLIENHHTTVLIVSHSNDQIERLCNKAIWIEKGKTRMIGPAHDVCQAYRALGGHRGNAESESKVFETLFKNSNFPAKAIHEIADKDQYLASIRAAQKASEIMTSDVLVIAAGNNCNSQVMAGSLAGMLKAFVLLAPTDEFPLVLASTIQQLKPKKVVALEWNHEFIYPLAQTLQSSSETIEQVDLISEEDIGVLSEKAFAYACDVLPERPQDLALVTSERFVPSLISAAGLIYGQSIPVLYTDNTAKKSLELLKRADELGYHHIVTMNYDAGQRQELESALASLLKDTGSKDTGTKDKDTGPNDTSSGDAGSGVTDLVDTGSGDTDKRGLNATVSDFSRLSPHSFEKALTELLPSQDFGLDTYPCFVASQRSSAEIWAAAPLCAAQGSFILPLDQDDMDDMAEALAELEKRKPHIKSLIYVGRHGSFDSISKDLLAKALSDSSLS